MEELLIEEKAKRYDEAIKRIENIKTGKCETTFMFTEGLFEHIFPELKESEDERIRKELLQIANENDDSFYMVMTPNKRKRLIAWLEKQGEHAKFRDSIQVGDKVTRNQDGVLVNQSQLKRVAKKDEKQGEQKYIPKYKIGDYVKNTNYKGEPIYEIIYMDKECYICEYRGKENMGDKAVMHFSFDNPYLRLVQNPADKVEPKFKVGDTVKDPYGDLYHITEITDDSYKTDDGRFILFKNQEVYTLSNFTAWSEEDEVMLDKVIERLHKHSAGDKEYLDIYYWLIALKDRVQPQPKQEWKPSDEQMDALRYVTNFDYGGHKATLVSLYEQLKKLK